jgi:hypothetical protein
VSLRRQKDLASRRTGAERESAAQHLFVRLMNHPRACPPYRSRSGRTSAELGESTQPIGREEVRTPSADRQAPRRHRLGSPRPQQTVERRVHAGHRDEHGRGNVVRASSAFDLFAYGVESCPLLEALAAHCRRGENVAARWVAGNPSPATLT